MEEENLRAESRMRGTEVLQDVVGFKKRFAAEESFLEREARLTERERKLKTLKGRLEAEAKELDDWAAELENREGKLQDMHDRLLAFEAEKRNWEDNKRLIIDEFKSMEQELAEKEKLLDERKARLDAFEERIMEGMKLADELEKKSAEAQELKNRNDIREAKLLSISRDVEENRDVLQERLKDMDMREAAVASAEAESIRIQNENMRLQSDVQDMMKRLSAMEEKYAVMKEEAAQASRLRNALSRAETERDNLRKNIVDKSRTRDIQTIHDLNEKIRNLEMELQRKNVDERRRLSDLSALERRIRDLERLEKEPLEEEHLEKDPQRRYQRISSQQTANIPTYPPSPGAEPVDEKDEGFQPASPRRKGDAEIWYQKGMALMKKTNFRPAVLCFDHALEKSPRDPEVMLQKARALYASNGNVQASRLLEELTNLAPDDADTWELKALNLHKMHHEIDALEAFEKAIELEKRPSSMKLAGRLLQKRGQHEKALIYINEALRMDPGDSQCWKMKASVLSDMGRHNEAGEALRNSRGQIL